MGLAHAGADACTPTELMRNADIAMHEARQDGRDRVVVFTGAMRNDLAGKLALQTDLRNAVTRGELLLHYQPIFDTATGRPVGVEALVRWRHPECGVVPPGLFTLAEQGGLIRGVGRWVLDHACRQLRAWHDRFSDLRLRLSVNASPDELRTGVTYTKCKTPWPPPAWILGCCNWR